MPLVIVRVNGCWHMLHLIGASSCSVCMCSDRGGSMGAWVCLLRKSATSAANAVRSTSDRGNS